MRQRQTDRQRDRNRQTDRDRQRETERAREKRFLVHISLLPSAVHGEANSERQLKDN